MRHEVNLALQYRAKVTALTNELEKLKSNPNAVSELYKKVSAFVAYSDDFSFVDLTRNFSGVHLMNTKTNEEFQIDWDSDLWKRLYGEFKAAFSIPILEAVDKTHLSYSKYVDDVCEHNGLVFVGVDDKEQAVITYFEPIKKYIKIHFSSAYWNNCVELFRLKDIPF